MSIEEISIYMLTVIIIQTIAILLTLIYLYFSTKNEMRNIKQSTEMQVNAIKDSTNEQIDIINKSTEENLKGFQSMITQLEKIVDKLSIIASKIEEEEKNKPKLVCRYPQFKNEILLRKGVENDINIGVYNSGKTLAREVFVAFKVPKQLNPIYWKWGDRTKTSFKESNSDPGNLYLHLNFEGNLEFGIEFPTEFKFIPTDVGDYKISYRIQCIGYPPFEDEIPVKVVA